jgi:hypothetical protein
MAHAVDEGYGWDAEMTELAEGHINPSAIAEAGKAEGGASSKNKERSKGRKGSQGESKSGGQRKSESRGKSESQDKSEAKTNPAAVARNRPGNKVKPARAKAKAKAFRAAEMTMMPI